ncbi:MAG: HpcH/HpaI aldolase/citrate lyase family protein [Acidimicrobiia bacterium]
MGLREAAASDGAIGGWCTITAPFIAEIMATGGGFDYVAIDCQHGLLDYSGMVSMLHALARTPVTPIVRVPSNDWSAIGKALDAGAHGVIVPMVNSRVEAQAAVAACRYAPEGTRSMGPIRASMSIAGTTAEVNRQVMCFAMIETAEAVAEAEAICATPGLDGIYVGPHDLAISMGVEPNGGIVAGPLQDAMMHVLSCCRAAGVVPGTHCADGAAARVLLDLGFRMASLGGDMTMLRRAIAAELAAVKQ